VPRKHRGAEEDNDGGEADRHRVTVPVAANVRRLRTARGVTQEALAERVGCATKYLQSVERAEANLSARMLGALARALAVDVARLLEPVADGALVRTGGAAQGTASPSCREPHCQAKTQAEAESIDGIAPGPLRGPPRSDAVGALANVRIR
jgi:transcriptional regulator with XRE-family HTH domain